jgi:hypothetical protein
LGYRPSLQIIASRLGRKGLWTLLGVRTRGRGRWWRGWRRNLGWPCRWRRHCGLPLCCKPVGFGSQRLCEFGAWLIRLCFAVASRGRKLGRDRLGDAIVPRRRVHGACRRASRRSLVVGRRLRGPTHSSCSGGGAFRGRKRGATRSLSCTRWF